MAPNLNYIECAGCRKQLTRTKTKPEKYRKHKDDRTDTPCDYGGTEVPQEVLCRYESARPKDATVATTARPAESSPDDAPESATSATPSTPSSPSSPEPADGASTASAQDALPGATAYLEELNETATAQTEAYRERVESGLTPFSQPTPHDYERPTLFSQPLDWCPCMEVHGKIKCQGTCQPVAVRDDPPVAPPAPPPATSFSRPAGAKSEEPAIEMGDLGKEMTARLKELFYAYDNRRSADNRSAQVTMGPSEMGTPCDRRLALSLMRMPPVNPGGDGWAAFVGTCIHAGLEQMFMWADAGTGRFAVEQRLEFPSELVPKGTADLIDRTLFMLDDHKCQGRWSRNKLKSQGPSKTYRVQAHVYAKGARLRGERIDHVAIISWPRDEATLDDLYVWTEPYNPAIADAAFERVDSIYAEVSRRQAECREAYPDAEDLEINARVGASFVIDDESCRYCPFHLPNSRDPLRGCNGKR